ncbi:pantoate--beta-alanine ligase [Echinimonas agarilytica]|uniref:Pantothenate synthetase n=1 Tax=Echinimonas agarilytica TaxID=1215918 RepID=A0AA41W4S6_9GAMM|nr:pantoate--beta-alanine ligase [Echinimonas agarilytica]MCM2678756.1 pantoate--beta-alanine ligase [Echinimonas agarilytica]
MIISEHIDVIRETVREWKQEGLKVGFVPTMGNLHQGHLTLVKEAFKHADRVVVSIFVNPMQFNNASDLDNYPRTLTDDCSALDKVETDLVFCPTPAIMYPKGLDAQSQVSVPGVADVLEGAMRPGHFTGVATVVTMLFNIVQPDVACFGEKDFQQLAVIRAFTKDLCLPINIIGVPTVREDDGLAMSSRNGYLTSEQRQIAPLLAQVMKGIETAVRAGEKNYSELIEHASQQLDEQGFKTDSIDICDANTLAPANSDTTEHVVLMAAFLGKARLIDNIVVNLQDSII